jgi:hypothetical protein
MFVCTRYRSHVLLTGEPFLRYLLLFIFHWAPRIIAGSWQELIENYMYLKYRITYVRQKGRHDQTRSLIYNPNSAHPPDGDDSGDMLHKFTLYGDDQLCLDGDIRNTVTGHTKLPTMRMVIHKALQNRWLTDYVTQIRSKQKANRVFASISSETKPLGFHHRRDSKTNRPSSPSRDSISKVSLRRPSKRSNAIELQTTPTKLIWPE